MHIIPFESAHIPQAAALFAERFAALRRRVPILPGTLADPACVEERLGALTGGQAVAAFDGDRLIGYLGGFVVDHFRETTRRAAYCPEWGHAVAGDSTRAVYNTLYRAISAQWANEGCDTHCLTLLAGDRDVEQTWFWSGFGMVLLDAIRPLDALDVRPPAGLTVRQAAPQDADALAELDAEHWTHYAQPPVFMVPQPSTDAAEFAALLDDPNNSVWLALDGDTLAGFMRFEGRSHGAAAIVEDDATTAITGAYVRPAYRGRGAAPALLDAALRHYAAQGFARCSVDFESFNPEAAHFWPKYFEPVCVSVLRVPEHVGQRP